MAKNGIWGRDKEVASEIRNVSIDPDALILLKYILDNEEEILFESYLQFFKDKELYTKDPFSGASNPLLEASNNVMKLYATGLIEIIPKFDPKRMWMVDLSGKTIKLKDDVFYDAWHIFSSLDSLWEYLPAYKPADEHRSLLPTYEPVNEHRSLL